MSRVATIGRQNLYASLPELEESLALVNRADKAVEVAASSGGWAESFLRTLGAKTADSFDVSAFEGATHVADMNKPLPPDWEGSYSAVLDGGSLEHIFDVPSALQNFMRLVADGGHLLLISPTNNEAGHGFYQFSPEFFFRALSPAYGFQTEEILLVDPAKGRGTMTWYVVVDPAEVGRRSQFRTEHATYLYIRARRIGPVRAWDPIPMQSDYAAAWETGRLVPPDTGVRRSARSRLGAMLPAPAQRMTAKLLHTSRARRAETDGSWVRSDVEQQPEHFRKLSSIDPRQD
jgi:hypothetical protein